MVLGLRTKNRKSPTVHTDYLVHVQEIKPWPPSQSLRSLRSVILQWENGERNSGSTGSVVPSLGSGIGDGKIDLNESFKIPVTLLRDYSIKGGDSDAFQKNYLEFNLYEPRRDKTKGQLLGTATVDLADCGILRESLSINIPMNCKRSFRNTAQPMLFINIHPFNKGQPSYLPTDQSQKEASLHKNEEDSVSALINEKYAEEAEIASFTDDDDVSPPSSATDASSNGGSPQNRETRRGTVKDGKGGADEEHDLDPKLGFKSSGLMPLHGRNNLTSLSSSVESNMAITSQENVVHAGQSSSTSSNDVADEASSTRTNGNHRKDLTRDLLLKVSNGRSSISSDAQENHESMNNKSVKETSPKNVSEVVENFANFTDSEVNVEAPVRNVLEEAAQNGNTPCGLQEYKDHKEWGNGYGSQRLDEVKLSEEPTSLHRFSEDSGCKQPSPESDPRHRDIGMRNNSQNTDRLKHVKSVRSPLDSARGNGLLSSSQGTDEARDSGLVSVQNGAKTVVSYELRDAKNQSKETKGTTSSSKIQQLEQRVKMLEGELREAAAIEVALYSVVADHGSSVTKVHAPARRLSRVYLHFFKESSQAGRAGAAKSAVSGLVLVAKACGNDVSRLTFWLSNSVMLRVIITQAIENQQLQLSTRAHSERNGSEKGGNKRSPTLKWKESSSNKKGNSRNVKEAIGAWDDPCTFISALEKLEAWIFSRVVESIWWQTLTPYMQPVAAKSVNDGTSPGSRKNYRRTSSSVDQEQGDFSIELWKKAFRDACERICPVRAEGHACGCLPVLARLIMEQCVARLDVAMFNAILRESSEDIPTDPVSDPISDPKVLPVPVGKSSFGAGAQLKNTIGNWSRWLTDLFGMDEDDSFEGETECNDDDGGCDASSKSFRLLYALSDLMMLPKDMLLNRSIRKEVCPTFGAPLIKRVLNAFVSDEFCPDPIPEDVLEALDSEDPLETGKEVVTTFPCTAALATYLPPSVSYIAGIIGETGSQAQLRRSGSSVLRKSYTSDDELDELDAPLSSIVIENSRDQTPKSNRTLNNYGSQNTVRYQLLREVWLDSE